MSNNRKSGKKQTAKAPQKKTNFLPILAVAAVVICIAVVLLVNQNGNSNGNGDIGREVNGVDTTVSGKTQNENDGTDTTPSGETLNKNAGADREIRVPDNGDMNTSLFVQIGVLLSDMCIHFQKLHARIRIDYHVDGYTTLDHEQQHSCAVFPARQ